MDKESGAGKVGVYAWIDTRIDDLSPTGPARLQDCRQVMYCYLPTVLISAIPQHCMIIFPESDRNGSQWNTARRINRRGSFDTGLRTGWLHRPWHPVEQDHTGNKGEWPFDALARGWSETLKTIDATFRGIGSLFMGVNVLRAVSGPARITWMVGQIASDGFSAGLASGITVSFNFLAVLSIGLFAMNLLPIPILDGGWIVLFIIEAIRRKAAKVKTVLRYQTIGLVAIAALFLMTTVGDILFFAGR
jgi:regulator of sigma E protease